MFFRGNSNYQQLTSNLKKIILCGNLRVICGNLRSDIFLEGTAIISNCSAIQRFFLIAVLLLAIIRKLISFAVSVQKKKGSGSKSKSDWVSFSDAKVLHFNLADAHVCSCLLILSGEMKGLLSGDN